MKHTAKRSHGFALLALLVLLVLLAVLALTINRRSALRTRMSANSIRSTQVYLGQNAAVENAIWKLGRDASWRTGRYTDLKFATSTIDTRAGRFLVNGLEAGDQIAVVASTPNNNGFYNIVSASAFSITVTPPLPQPGGVWMGQATIAALDGARHVYSDLTFIQGTGGVHDRITTAAGNFLTAGFVRNGQIVLLQSFPANDGTYYVAGVAAKTIELDPGVLVYAGTGVGTLAMLRGERFDYNGIQYTRSVVDRTLGDADDFIAIACALHGAAAGITDLVRVPVWRNFYIADYGNHRVRQCDAGANRIMTIAGNSDPASLLKPSGLWVDAYGNIYVADTENYVTRRRAGISGAVEVMAGNGSSGYSGDGGPALEAQIRASYGVSVDSWGNVYIADSANNRIRKVAASGLITTVAGNGDDAFAGDGGAATLASLRAPWSVHADAARNLTIADTENNRIRRVDAATGIITTVAGSGSQGYDGDATPPTQAKIDNPRNVCVDAAGNVYIADTDNHRIRKVAAEIDPETGFRLVTTVAGNGEDVYSGDGGPAGEASLKTPSDLCLDAAGNLYIADTGNNRIRKVDAVTGVITTVAGNGVATYSGDGGLATSASLKAPCGVAVDDAGDIFIADTGNHRVRKVSASDGTIQTLAGTGSGGDSGDGGMADEAQLNAPQGVAVDNDTEIVYIADTGNSRVRRVDGGNIETAAGTGSAGYNGDGGAATGAELNKPRKICVSWAGSLFIADADNNRIRKVDLSTTIITTVAGNGDGGYLGDGVLATSTRLNKAGGVTVDAAGNLLIADTGNARIRKVAFATQIITTEAGSGNAGYWGDANPATQALLNKPKGVFEDSAGNVYISDTDNRRIRKVLASKGIIYCIAGNGTDGYGGDGGPAVDALLDTPLGIWVDASGDVYVADSENHRIRKLDVATGTIQTVAGNGAPGYAGDGADAPSASLKTPADVVVDAWGGIIIADTENNVIRKVYPDTGRIGTLIGEVSGGYIADGVPAVDALLNFPSRVARDASGNFYLADTENNRIRKIDLETGIIETIAGIGEADYGGDGGLATAAAINMPAGVHVDGAGNVLIADTENSRIRRIDAISGIISTLAGTGAAGFSGDGGDATVAQICKPASVRADADGNVLIADTENHVIRRINADNGTISTIAGIGGLDGYNGDGISATSATLKKPHDLWTDPSGNLYIADTENHRIRRVDAATDIITTVAGNGDDGYDGEDGPAIAASLDKPEGVSVDTDGNIFIADTRNQCIRRVDAETGIIRRVAGKDGEAGFSGDDGDPRGSKMNEPKGVWVDQTVSTGGGVVRP